MRHRQSEYDGSKDLHAFSILCCNRRPNSATILNSLNDKYYCIFVDATPYSLLPISADIRLLASPPQKRMLINSMGFSIFKENVEAYAVVDEASR